MRVLKCHTTMYFQDELEPCLIKDKHYVIEEESDWDYKITNEQGMEHYFSKEECECSCDTCDNHYSNWLTLEGGNDKNLFTFFNDSNKSIPIHTGTWSHGVKGDKSDIKPLELREFELPNGTYPLLKQWDSGMIIIIPNNYEDKRDNDNEYKK